MPPEREGVERYDEKWHARVDRALFGQFDDATGIWVDGILQSLADSRRFERTMGTLLIRVGLPLFVIITVAVVVTALHQPPELLKAIGAGIGGVLGGH